MPPAIAKPHNCLGLSVIGPKPTDGLNEVEEFEVAEGVLV